MVPAGAPAGETPSLRTPLLPLCCHGAGTLRKRRPEHVPHPECGSRTFWNKSLILVITRVEAGDRGPSCRWRPRCPCWPTVGGQRFIGVDTWTTRRLYTDGGVSPLPLPRLPPVRPQPSRSVREAGCKARPLPRWTATPQIPETETSVQVRAARQLRRTTGTAVVRRPRRPGGGDLLSSRGHEISPGCAHSWGQLLDLSIEVTVRTPLLTAPSRCRKSTAPWGHLWTDDAVVLDKSPGLPSHVAGRRRVPPCSGSAALYRGVRPIPRTSTTRRRPVRGISTTGDRPRTGLSATGGRHSSPRNGNPPRWVDRSRRPGGSPDRDTDGAQPNRGTEIGGGWSPEDDSNYCRALLLMRAVSSVTWV
jgi:hypothetical protein